MLYVKNLGIVPANQDLFARTRSIRASDPSTERIALVVRGAREDHEDLAVTMLD